tara:strand:+ start:787 stop:4482 length:3696 start_codon:yes stop_codon:yes gene_type:complete
MIQFDKPQKLSFRDLQGLSKPVTRFEENYSAARKKSQYLDQSQSRDRILKDLWDPIVEEISELFPNETFIDPGDGLLRGAFSATATPGKTRSDYEWRASQIIDFLNQNQEIIPDHLKGITIESLEDLASERAKAAKEYNDQIASRAVGTSGQIGQFVGQTVGIFEDPMVLSVLPIGIASKSLYKLAFFEASLGAGVTAISESSVKQWYEKQGYDYTWNDFIRNVGFAAVGSAALPVGFRVTVDTARGGFNAIAKAGKANKDSQFLERAARDSEEFEADNPFVDSQFARSQAEHYNRTAESDAAVFNNKAPAISDETTIQPTQEIIASSTDNLNGVMFSVPARDVLIDAKRFQFKEGGDEYGVTERLQGVTEWDNVKAGTVILWEDVDGKIFIADGHQRAGLAKRIMDQDPSQDINLVGYKLREVDGISAEKARVIAATANIAQGTGTAIDAAKILRVEPERLSELPPRSILVSQARDLEKLSEEAFGSIVNGVIPQNYGAIVGRLIDDPDKQQAAIQVLAKSDAANAFQAETIVRQVNEQDLVKEVQSGLFGDEVLAESLFLERARVLDRTYKILREDKTAFENLSKNADRIEAEGNKLEKIRNQERANQNGKAITLLQALATRKGELSDELSAAARTARETNNYANAARGFAESVRRGIERGDFDRAEVGDVRRTFDDAPKSRQDAIEDEPSLEGFDEPSGKAAEDQTDQLILNTFRTFDAPRERSEGFARYLDDAEVSDATKELLFKSGDNFNVMRNIFQEDLDDADPLQFGADELSSVLGREISTSEVRTVREDIKKITQDGLKDQPQIMTVYRVGEVLEDTPQSYTLNPNYNIESNLPWRKGKGEKLTAYQVNKDDILASPDITERGRIGEDEVIIRGEVLIRDDKTTELKELPTVIGEEIPGETNAKVIEKSFKDRQPVQTVDDIYKIAQESQDFVVNIGRTIEKDLGVELKNPGLKLIETAREKMGRKNYKSSNEMTDISRAGFVINKAEQADEIAERFAREAEILDEGWMVTPSGYFDRKLLVRTPNGIVSEIQIWSPKLLDAKIKKGGHKMYQEARSIEKTNPKRAEELSEKQRVLYEKALSEEDVSFLKVAGKGKLPKFRSNSDINAFSSGITRPVLKTSRPSTDIQEPPGSTIARASVGEKEIAGRPSQSTSIRSDIAQPPTRDIADPELDIKPEDFDIEIPVDLRVEGENIVTQTRTLRDVKAELDAEDALINRLGVCSI